MRVRTGAHEDLPMNSISIHVPRSEEGLLATQGGGAFVAGHGLGLQG